MRKQKKTGKSSWEATHGVPWDMHLKLSTEQKMLIVTRPSIIIIIINPSSIRKRNDWLGSNRSIGKMRLVPIIIFCFAASSIVDFTERIKERHLLSVCRFLKITFGSVRCSQLFGRKVQVHRTGSVKIENQNMPLIIADSKWLRWNFFTFYCSLNDTHRVSFSPKKMFVLVHLIIPLENNLKNGNAFFEYGKKSSFPPLI